MGIAMEHMVLAATEMGLATCWVGWFDERKIKKTLSIPSGWKVVSILTVGYADEGLKTRDKKTLPIEEILFFK
ncbi:MAG: nitroreductase family protein [Candidatus Humimicrobiaceae bacterium]